MTQHEIVMQGIVGARETLLSVFGSDASARSFYTGWLAAYLHPLSGDDGRLIAADNAVREMCTVGLKSDDQAIHHAAQSVQRVLGDGQPFRLYFLGWLAAAWPEIINEPERADTASSLLRALTGDY